MSLYEKGGQSMGSRVSSCVLVAGKHGKTRMAHASVDGIQEEDQEAERIIYQ